MNPRMILSGRRFKFGWPTAWVVPSRLVLLAAAVSGLWWGGNARANIALQDGTPLTAATSDNAASVSTSFTVTTGAQVLVVVLYDRNQSLTAATNGPSPSSLSWGTQTITRVVSQSNLTSHYADSDIFYLWNPTPGTQTITATDTTGQTPTAMTMEVFSLNGVNTSVAPGTFGVGNPNIDSVGYLNLGVTNVEGAWAVVNASAGDSSAENGQPGGLSITSSSGMTNWLDIPNNQDQAMGVVENLTQGANTLTAVDPTQNGTQVGFAAAIFAPLTYAFTPPPTNVVATGQTNQVALSWQDASGGVVTNYIVLRSTASGGGYSAIATNIGNAATNYTDTSVVNYTTYYYVVEEAGPIGLSPFSSSASAFATGMEPAPTGLSATPANTQVALAWNATLGATGYNILRASNSPSGFTTIGSSAATAYTDTGLSNGTTYYYEVNATNSFGAGPNSAYVSAIPGIPTNAPLPAYPLRPNPNGRYVVDTNNAPFLVIGDSPHTLMVNLDQADAAAYLVNRGSNGFNCLWVNLLCDGYDGGPGSEGNANYGHDIYGDNPFTNLLAGGYYDLTTPNAAFWSNADYVVRSAGTNGLQIFALPLDQGGWTKTSLANGSNNCFAYGQFLGSRYASAPNIFWNLGNDFGSSSVATNEDVILAIAKGILSKDTNHLMTLEFDSVSMSLDDPNWARLVTVNGVYTYNTTYAECYAAWNKSNMPALMLEANYEFEDNTGAEPSSPWVLRVQEYWSLLAGCLAGHMYGNHYTYNPFNPAYYNTPGMTQLMYFKHFFGSRAWYNLVPDQGHHLITAGFGISNSSSSTLTANNFVTAAMTADGTLGVAYAPTNATLTVAMTNFIGPVTASWFDPSGNTYMTITGSPFSNTITTNLTTPGINVGGDTDWVLLLQAQAPPLIPPQITGAAFNSTNFVVSFSTVSGQKYALQDTTILGGGPWLTVATNIPGTGGIVQATDTNAASQSQRFYRVETGK